MSAALKPRASARVQAAWQALEAVADPEIPVISLCDLGVVRDVREAGAVLEIVLTPTYSGCPATEVIAHDAQAAVEAAGLGPVRTLLQRAPAWTTDWISARGRAALREYGIAPPGPVPLEDARPICITRRRQPPVPCPRCASTRTERIAPFGSTPCKALYRCLACHEPFEHFKPI
ncbi:MAG: phenylacetate-CoA oxygenase subunit PaaJ [Comamonadaceae bacterium]|nr:phenylacetate-CoA oxygenase subunit PaaJ [Burkholderiales bacterium]MEB2347172.1 phenylacetate-CoA oxygenase subunit PaaJ [Comamonadaceae bacterium]